MGRMPTEQASERADGIAADASDVAKDEGTTTAAVEARRPDLDTGDREQPPDLLSPPSAKQDHERVSPDLLGPPSSKLSDRQRKPSRPDQPFEAWEREELEAQLCELVGNLGALE